MYISYSYLSDLPSCFQTAEEKMVSLSDVESLCKQHYTCEAVLDLAMTGLHTQILQKPSFFESLQKPSSDLSLKSMRTRDNFSM